MPALRNILRSPGLPRSHSLHDSKASSAILMTQQESPAPLADVGCLRVGGELGIPSCLAPPCTGTRSGGQPWARGVFGLRSEGFARLHGFGEKTLLSSHAVFLVLIADKFCGGLCGNRVEVRLVPCLLWCFTALGIGSPRLFCFCE